MMKRMSMFMLMLLAASTCSAAENEADFLVSASGSDDWSGTLAEANSQGSDGPFATLERARDAVAELKRKTSDIVVLIRGGTYLDSATLDGLNGEMQGFRRVGQGATATQTHHWKPNLRSAIWWVFTADAV